MEGILTGGPLGSDTYQLEQVSWYDMIRICAGHHWLIAKSALDFDIFSFSYDHPPQEHSRQGDDADMICVKRFPQSLFS